MVAFAVIVFGFSLQSQPPGLGTTIAPGQFFTNLPATVASLEVAKFCRSFAPGRRVTAPSPPTSRSSCPARPGRASADSASAPTASPPRPRAASRRWRTSSPRAPASAAARSWSSATATRWPRPGKADLYSTAILLDLARALSGETLSRSVMLVSTSGQIGSAGASRLAESLAGQPVDGVIVLGDLAGSATRPPVVVPWSSTDALGAASARQHPVRLCRHRRSGLHNASSGLAGQVARLAFPFAITEQAPFAVRGIPAVLLSLSGDRPIAGNIAIGSATRTANLATAVLQTINALDHGPLVGAPRGYLELSGQLVPMWAIRLLVLALILPVAAADLDAVARTRRRGHTLTRWLAWVLTGAVPFVVGLMALLVARAAGLLSATPAGAVGSVGVPRTGGDLAVMLGIVALVVLSFLFLRPLCLRGLAQQLPDSGRRPESPAADAAAVSLSVVLCLLTLIVWALNPFAALLLVPALHLWLWLAQPGARSRRWSIALLLLVGVLPGGLVLFYYANAYGLSPVELAWSLALMPGGAMSVAAALYWSLALGCLASAVVIGLRTMRAAATAAEAPVTVRGPASYAGPGSLGGTKSALRR